MKILRAVGLGLTIIMLQFLVPRIFAGFENTLLMFFGTLQTSLGLANQGMQGQAGAIFPLIK